MLSLPKFVLKEDNPLKEIVLNTDSTTNKATKLIANSRANRSLFIDSIILQKE